MRVMALPMHVLLWIAAFAILAPAAVVNAQRESVPGEVLVRYAPTSTNLTRLSALERNQIVSIKDYDAIDWGLVKLPIAIAVDDALSQLMADPAISYAQPNYIYRDVLLSAPDDTDFSKQWYLHNTSQAVGYSNPAEYTDCVAGADIDAVAAWNFFSGSDTVVVGV
jgi:hypothetical protein